MKKLQSALLILFTLFTSCATKNLQYGPFRITVPKDFTKLNRAQADSVLYTFAGSFKEKNFYDFYSSNSLVYGLYNRKDNKEDYDIEKQAKTYHGVYLSNIAYLKDNEDKYINYSIEILNGNKCVIRNFYSDKNNDKKYYDTFNFQFKTDVLLGIVVYSQKDSLSGKQLFRNITRNVNIKP